MLTFLTAAPFLALALGLAATPLAFGLAADAFLALGLAAAGAAESPSALVSVLVSALAEAFLVAVFFAAGFLALLSVAFLGACRRRLASHKRVAGRVERQDCQQRAGSRKVRRVEGGSKAGLQSSILTAFFLGAFFRASPSL